MNERRHNSLSRNLIYCCVVFSSHIILPPDEESESESLSEEEPLIFITVVKQLARPSGVPCHAMSTHPPSPYSVNVGALLQTFVG